jgi:hypothetical protein
MKKLVYSALALSLTGMPALATDNGWLGLDKEIENLTSSLEAANPNAPTLSGWILTSYRHSSDISVPFDLDFDGDGDPTTNPSGDNDQSGFQFDSVRLQVEGDAGNNYSYKISFDFESGEAELKDAFVKWQIHENINGKIGRFKEAMLQSALVGENRLLFLERTFLGDILGRRELGIAVLGSFDVVNWQVQAQDGADGQGDEHKFVARLSANVIGKAGQSKNEGAYGAGDETNVNVGIAYQDDTTVDDGGILTLDASLTTGPISVAAELADFGEGEGGTYLFDGRNTAETTPWDITVSYLITPEWEVAGRYEDLDDEDDTTSYVIGVNRYVRGHDIKWGAQWRSIMSDPQDVDQLGIGLGLSF